MIPARIDALVLARAQTIAAPVSIAELVRPLARFGPADLTPAAWRDALDAAIAGLIAREILGADHRPIAKDPLATALGPHRVATWTAAVNHVLPGLGLGLAPDDRAVFSLASCDAWAAAIAGRALGMWTTGSPPSLAALCDGLAWRRLDLPGKPKRCPPEVRAVFVQRELATPPGPPDRLVRQLAARAVGTRPELRALREGLVRMWLVGRELGSGDVVGRELGDGPGNFSDAVRAAIVTTRDGAFGDRKVFISSVWRELVRTSPWSSLSLDEFKSRLVGAHQRGELALARADLVAAMDPQVVAASETTTDGTSFHFILREAS